MANDHAINVGNDMTYIACMIAMIVPIINQPKKWSCFFIIDRCCEQLYCFINTAFHLSKFINISVVINRMLTCNRLSVQF